MQIPGIENSSTFAGAALQQTNQDTSPFQSHFTDAFDGDENPVQEFMDYAKETPAQRLFTDWLGSQNITQAQFNAMSPKEQQKLVEKFQEQLKHRLAPTAPAMEGLNSGAKTQLLLSRQGTGY